MEIGQIVIIKTRGLVNFPIMQIKKIDEVSESLKIEDDKLQDSITCFWFDTNNVYREHSFNADELEIHTEWDSQNRFC
jgi:hypothetical protein